MHYDSWNWVEIGKALSQRIHFSASKRTEDKPDVRASYGQIASAEVKLHCNDPEIEATKTG